MSDRSDAIDCPACGGPFQRVFGNIYEDGRGVAIYSLDLHAEAGSRFAYLAMGTVGEDGKPYGVVCRLWNAADGYRLAFGDPPADPHFQVFGTLMNRSTALRSPLKDTFFHYSEHICESDVRVREHFGGRNA